MSDSGKARSDYYGQLITRLDAKRLKRNEPLAQYTTFRIGGPADLFYDATSVEDLAGAVTAATQRVASASAGDPGKSEAV